MGEVRTCNKCEHWEMGIPCGTCRHPKASYLPTNDDMVFYNAGDRCPMNKENIREEYINHPEKIVFRLKEYMSAIGIKGAVVGISGGKDSTIVAKLMVECLGKENVMGVLMPHGDQSDIDDSYAVVNLLDIPYMVVNIKESMKGIVDRLEYSFRNIHNSDIEKELTEPAYINIAPRIRMTTLYAIAQSMGNGWRVIGTTNKSEEYIGWLTKWGDGGVDFEPIIDFTVTELHRIGQNLGLPKHLVCKTPIDGLAAGSDEERIGFTYAALDKYIAEGTSGDKEVDEKIEKMHKYSEHKRISIPCFKVTK